MRRVPFRVINLLAVLAVLTYQSWLTAPALNPGLPTATSFASELASTSQPNHWFFRSADVLTGLLVLVVAVLLSRFRPAVLRSWPRWVRRFLLLGATLFAAATFLDAAFPMPCADSLLSAEVIASKACQTFSLRMHEIASVAVGWASVSASALTIWVLSGARRRGLIGEDGAESSRTHLLFSTWLGVLVCTFAGIHILTTGATVTADLFGWPAGMGWYQRVSILTVSLWWWALVTGFTVPHAPRSPSPRTV